MLVWRGTEWRGYDWGAAVEGIGVKIGGAGMSNAMG